MHMLERQLRPRGGASARTRGNGMGDAHVPVCPAATAKSAMPCPSGRTSESIAVPRPQAFRFVCPIRYRKRCRRVVVIGELAET
eukprot:8782032-Pyramimonas_sp.AAC.1